MLVTPKQGMDQITPLHVTNHYRRNKVSYDVISQRLAETKAAFLSATRDEQVTMLQKSHSFAVISVQTPVKIHEEAFRNLWSGSDKPSRPVTIEALTSVNYNRNKTEYIQHSLSETGAWSDVADLLEAGKVDEAHKKIMTDFKGVGPAKAPFVLAMLGFEEKACIDANIVRLFQLDGHVTTSVVDKYEQVITDLRSKMPTLSSMTTPFLWQWVCFDYQRGEISFHDVWFKAIGTL